MEFRQLETFAEVAAHLSFRRAGERLHLTQSSVSAQIKALEESLGARLFDRLGRRIALTPAGETLLERARTLLALRDETRDRLADRDAVRCTLRVRMPQSLGMALLPEVLPRFHAAHPRVGLDVGDCAFAELPRELRSGAVDLAFLLADSVPFAELEARLLGTAGLTFACSMSNGFSAPATWEDLGRTRLFLPKHDCSYRMILEAELRDRDIEPPCLVELGCLSTLLRLVAEGQGAALLPDFCLRTPQGENLRPFTLPGQPRETGVLLIRHRRKQASEELKDFMELCTQTVGALPSGSKAAPGGRRRST